MVVTLTGQGRDLDMCTLKSVRDRVLVPLKHL